MYCFLVKSYCSSSRFDLIDSFLQELRPWNLAEFKLVFVFCFFFSRFLDFFFAIFAAIGLNLGVMLFNQELLFHFAFQCD
jgi:hypothetical protein